MRLVSRFFFVAAILAILLALSSVQDALAATELRYDDGTDETYFATTQNNWLAVKFVFSDFGLSGSWKLLTARFYESTQEGGPDWLELHVLSSDGSGDLPGSTPVTFITNFGWNDVDLSGQNIMVSGDFWIAYKWLGQFQSPCLGVEYAPPPIDGRSYGGSPGSWTLDSTYDYMIRAEVGQSRTTSDPYHYVGGELFSANKLAVLSPYFALIGIVAVAAIVVRRKLN